MDTQQMVLRKWEALEKRWKEIRPEMALATITEQSRLEATIKRGNTQPRVFKMPGSEGIWEVHYAGIKVLYAGFGAEGKAYKFAQSLMNDSTINDQNLEAARQFINSCENWKDYESEENLTKFVNALMLIRPLDVNKIWATFRSMVDSGDLKPVHH